MADVQLVAAVGAVVLEIIKIKRHTINKKKRLWTRNWILRRNQLGASELLVKELPAEDPHSFMNLLRMNKDMFDFLLEKVGSDIQKCDTFMREAIPAKLKLEITCRYLATGDSLASMQFLYRVPKCSISKFLPEVFDAIYEGLKEFLQVPATENEWKDIQKGFNDVWNFPNCVGCIDGKHVLVQCPFKLGSQYCSSGSTSTKETFSMVLLAMTDHDYNFTLIDIGSYGSIADGEIFEKSSLMRAIEENRIDMPEGTVILGDSAFPLKTYLMKPYPTQNNLTVAEKIYNYRHCHARRIIENSFGILTSHFRVFRAPIRLHPETVVKLVKATCALHNWIRKSTNKIMTEDTNGHDLGRIIPGSWHNGNDRAGGMANVMPSQEQNYSPEARERRDRFARCFVKEGAVS